MASTGQIIPKYSHPHQMIVINDNTSRQAEVAAASFDLKTINVFSSAKGRDNVLIEMLSDSAYITEYGQPSMKYGQESYMPYVSLVSGYSSAYCMRVMPTDAPYANAVLIAEVRYADKPTKMFVTNPLYSSDPDVNPVQLKNPEYQELYIENPYKDMTTDELITAIGYNILMPNLNFDPTLEISEDNPLGVDNIYRIIDGGEADSDEEVDATYDGGEVEDEAEIIIDALALGQERNIFAGMDYIVNINYDPSIEEYVDNPDYIEELIQVTYPGDLKVHIALSVESVDLLSIDNDELDMELESILSEGETEDEDGYVRIPLMLFYCTGRGEFGNNYAISITSDTRNDKSNNYKNFIVQISNTDGSTNDLFSRVSFYEDSVSSSGISIYIEDIINDVDSGCDAVNLHCFQTGIERLAQFIEDNVGTEIDLSTFNVLFGTQKDGSNLTDVIYEVVRPNHINLATNSFTLTGGTDGSLSFDNPDRQAVLNQLYVDAFSGSIDRSILSRKRVPANYLFDANYDVTVKNAMKEMIRYDENDLNKRDDIQGFFDGGILNTSTELKNWVYEQSDDSRNCSVDPFHFKVRDPFTKKVITVTVTYYLASVMAKHVSTNGIHVPLAQSKYATLSGIVKGSLKPVIDDGDHDLKELLYENGINYYEAIGENQFMRSTQITSQKTTSDLCLENNMRTLLTIIRRIEAINNEGIYGFAEESDRELYTNTAKRILEEYTGKYKEADVYFAMTEYEEEYNILHCYLSISFKNITERIITEVNINPRV